MSMDIAAQAVALKQAQTQQLAQIKMMKAANDMQKQLIEMIDSVARSAPAPDGQGSKVDKTA